jgi:hypothetical protein
MPDVSNPIDHSNMAFLELAKVIGGARRDRTADLLRARQALSQLSYGPAFTGLFRVVRRCTCRLLGHIHKYAPSLAPARALLNTKNPA